MNKCQKVNHLKLHRKQISALSSFYHTKNPFHLNNYSLLLFVVSRSYFSDKREQKFLLSGNKDL